MIAGWVWGPKMRIKPEPLGSISVVGSVGLLWDLQGPAAESHPDNLAVALESRYVLSGADRTDRLAGDHRSCQGCRHDGRPSTAILIVEGQIVEIGLVDSAEQEAL